MQQTVWYLWQFDTYETLVFGRAMCKIVVPWIGRVPKEFIFPKCSRLQFMAGFLHVM